MKPDLERGRKEGYHVSSGKRDCTGEYSCY